MNERLRTVLLREGVTEAQLAEVCGVDPKTVERWVGGRLPHRRHRWAVANRLHSDEIYLWPETAGSASGMDRSSELLEFHPDRASVPRETWLRLLRHAHERIDVLVMSGTFYAQVQPRIAAMLAERMEQGVRVRMAFSDPGCEAVAVRDREERLGGVMAAKVRASLTYYRDLVACQRFELRLHTTTLYNSMFRYDDEVIVNPHVYGAPASLNPTLHLRRSAPGGLFDQYLASFERVWATALPWAPSEVER